MHKKLLTSAITALLFSTPFAYADTETDTLKEQLDHLKQDYQKRIELLEARLQKMEKKTQEVDSSVKHVASQLEESRTETSGVTSSGQSTFNPAISLVLDGQYADYSNDPSNYQLPGFMLGGEAGLGNQSFALGESELTLSSNIDDQFYGQLTLAFGGDAGATNTSVEEAFFQTTGLANGLNIKGGRFFSALGYLNEQHAHAWDFSDAPLIYRGLFGDQLVNDGIQVNYVLPTDQFMQVGTEISNGSHFPAAGSAGGIGSWTAYFNMGDDIGIESSWALGLSHWQANHVDQRQGAFLGTATSFSGDSEINSLDFVYKWAKNGNPIDKNFKFQFEYLDRQEKGLVTAKNANSNYSGHQRGWYLQGVYQFLPQWKIGGRLDQLNSDNTGSNATVLSNSGLDGAFSPKRYSAMVEWLPSEFSRIRLQYNHDQSYQDSDNQLFLQYTYSLGSHGAHQY